VGKPKAPKKTKSDVPIAYARWLFAQAQAVGLSRDDLQVAAGFKPESETAWRLEQGKPEASVKAANKMRLVLVEKYGLDIPHVPAGEEDWTPPATDAAEADRPPRAGDSEDEIIRRNMIRFRQMLGLGPVAASDRAGIDYDDLVAWESGERQPSGRQLIKLAIAYCRRGGANDFIVVGDVEPPDPSLMPATPAVSVELHVPLNEEGQRRLEQLRAAAAELEDPKFHADQHAMVDHVLKARKKPR
jgi:DNA-binding XRE family transcriptional regulator